MGEGVIFFSLFSFAAVFSFQTSYCFLAFLGGGIEGVGREEKSKGI